VVFVIETKKHEGEYLVNPESAPYMIDAFYSTDKRDEIIAAIHPSDKTCRPQTLNENHNPLMVNFEALFAPVNTRRTGMDWLAVTQSE